MIKELLQDCVAGNHTLETIHIGTDKEGNHKNIRWCSVCGMVFIYYNQDEIGRLPSYIATKISDLFFKSLD